jgi:hypothetical protein
MTESAPRATACAVFPQRSIAPVGGRNLCVSRLLRVLGEAFGGFPMDGRGRPVVRQRDRIDTRPNNVCHDQQLGEE